MADHGCVIKKIKGGERYVSENVSK